MRIAAKLRFCIVLILVCLNISIIKSQISTVPGYNYYDINNLTFTVDASCLDLSSDSQEEINYWYTSFQLAESIQDMFLLTDPSPEDKIIGNYRISKRDFLVKDIGGENYSWVLIRPNDDELRPTIAITHGGATGNAGPRTLLSLGVADYVQRGYAVIFYQSAPSQNGDRLKATKDAGFLESCQYIWSPDDDIICFQQAVYFRTQISKAALQYTFAKAMEFHLDENNIFTLAFSGGAVSTLYAILSNENSFDDDLFSQMGSLTALSLFEDQPTEIKKVITIGGGMLGLNTEELKIDADFYSELESNSDFLLFHGQEDHAVLPDAGPLAWSDPQGDLEGSEIYCALELDNRFKARGISSKIIMSCSGGHDLITYPCDYNDDVFSNNPQFSALYLGECLFWLLNENYTNYDYENLCNPTNARDQSEELGYILMQIHDYSKIGAYFFHQSFPDSGPSRTADSFTQSLFNDQNLSAFAPKEIFENPDMVSNGHIETSEKCYFQDCNALYFNKEGFGNNILYNGDYLKLAGEGHNIFNNDFTLELIFRKIDHTGIGTLISRRNNLGLGFELFLNNEGKLQFNKNINGQASIIGNVVIDDGCHHVALTREGDKFTLILDQIEDHVSNTFPVNFPDNPPMRIGNTQNELASGNRGFNGIISSIRFSEKVLNPNEFSNINTIAEDALSNWILGVKQGQIISDESGEFHMILGNSENNINYDPKRVFQDEQCVCEPPGVIIATEDLFHDIKPELSIFPNPTNGEFKIDADPSFGILKNMEIFSMDGKKINHDFFPYKNSIFVDIEGIFLVKCTFERKILSAKLVVLKH